MKENNKNDVNKDTKSTNQANLRSRVWMYTQQLSHLPFDSVEALIRRVKSLNNLDKLAWIVHDQDIDNTGKQVASHVHVAFTVTKRTTLSRLTKLLNDRPEQFTSFTQRGQSVAQSTKNLMGYLVHHTKEAKKQGKHQYSLDEVHANFDYASYIEQTEKITSTKQILDGYANEDLNREQAESLLRVQGGMNLARNIKNLDAIDNYILNEKRKRWVAKKKTNNEAIKVSWLSGAAGTGKTSFAKEYAVHHGLSCFITSSQNDPFQGYRGEQVLIFDEVRPNVMNYADLLQICDPFLYEKNLTARYRNPAFQSDVIFITSVYSPLAFYNAMHLNSKIDTFDQLNRRIGMNLLFTNKKINQFLYDYDLNHHQWVTMNVTDYDNPYARNSLSSSFTLGELIQYGDKIGSKKYLKGKNYQRQSNKSDDLNNRREVN